MASGFSPLSLPLPGFELESLALPDPDEELLELLDDASIFFLSAAMSLLLLVKLHPCWCEPALVFVALSSRHAGKSSRYGRGLDPGSLA